MNTRTTQIEILKVGTKEVEPIRLTDRDNNHETDSESETDVTLSVISSAKTVSRSEKMVQKYTGVNPVVLNEMKENNYVLVNVTNKTSAKRHVAQIVELYGNYEFRVLYCKQKKEPDIFILQENVTDVEYIVQLPDIVGKLEDPTVLRRGELKFNVDSTEW